MKPKNLIILKENGIEASRTTTSHDAKSGTNPMKKSVKREKNCFRKYFVSIYKPKAARLEKIMNLIINNIYSLDFKSVPGLNINFNPNTI